MQTDRSKIESTGHGTGGPSYHSDGVPEIATSERSGFSGTFQSTLSDWIQLVQMGRRDAIVNVRTYDGKVGTLWCRDGDIIDAACDGFTGEDAVIRALAWQGGSVSVEFESISRRRLIQTGTSGLLLRAAYIHDVQEQEAPLDSLATDGASAGVDTAPPAPSRLDRRPLDLRFVAAGGLSVLLLFGGLAWRWIYAPTHAGAGAARLAPPESQPRERQALRPPATPRSAATVVAAGTTRGTATAASPLRAGPSGSPHAASASWPASLLWSRPAAASVAPARRHTVAAVAKRSGATSSTTSSSSLSASPTLAAAAPGEGRKASAVAGSKVEIVRESPARESPARVQVIEAHQPRVQIIEEREPHIEEIK